jgi:hypothetical protein
MMPEFLTQRQRRYRAMQAALKVNAYVKSLGATDLSVSVDSELFLVKLQRLIDVEFRPEKVSALETHAVEELQDALRREWQIDPADSETLTKAERASLEALSLITDARIPRSAINAVAALVEELARVQRERKRRSGMVTATDRG